MTKHELQLSRCNTKRKPVQNHLRNRVVPEPLHAPKEREGRNQSTEPA